MSAGERTVQGAPARRVMVVCVGNICRSPMGAAVLLERLSEHWPESVVESAGVAALVGQPADPLALDVMRNRHINLDYHRARQLTPELLNAFELILVMDSNQQRAVERMFTPARGRVQRLGRFGSFDIPDPYGKPRSAFESSLSLIERGIDDYVRAFWTPK